MELQEKLTRHRKEKGLSQMEVAEELGVSRQAVSRWETGAAMPTSENLICLSKLYGTTLDELILSEAEEKKQPELSQYSPPVRAAHPQKRIWPFVTVFLCLFFCIVCIWGFATHSVGMAIMIMAFVGRLLLTGLIIYVLVQIIKYLNSKKG